MSEEIRIREDRNRIELPLEGGTATLDYAPGGQGVLDFRSTVVPPELRGQGAGGRLVGQALDWARREGFRVIPTCSFVESYVEKHPEYRDLVA